jgi:hypothetical protein
MLYQPTTDGAAQIVQSDVLHLSRFADSIPGRMEVNQMRAGLFSANDVHIIFKPWDLLQALYCGVA